MRVRRRTGRIFGRSSELDILGTSMDQKAGLEGGNLLALVNRYVITRKLNKISIPYSYEMHLTV